MKRLYLILTLISMVFVSLAKTIQLESKKEIYFICKYKIINKKIKSTFSITNTSKDTLYILDTPGVETRLVSHIFLDWGGSVVYYDAGCIFSVIPIYPNETITSDLDFDVPSNYISHVTVGFSFLRKISNYISVDTLNGKPIYKMNYDYIEQCNANKVSASFW